MFAIRRSVFAASAVATAAVFSTTLHKKSKQSECFWGGGKMSADAIAKAKKDIAEAIEAEDEKREDGTSVGPTLVRLAWHASGTYSIHDKTGGSNGATMRMSPEKDWGAKRVMVDGVAMGRATTDGWKWMPPSDTVLSDQERGLAKAWAEDL